MDENAKRMLRLAELSMTLVGDPLDIFQKIASMIAEVLKVPLVCLTEIRGDELYFLSIYNKGEISTNAGHCPLNITPCANVEHSKDIRVYYNVTEHFPEAFFLKEQNAYSYCGVPSLDSSGNVIAVTCALTDKPQEFTEEDKSLLNIFAQRIGVEIERNKLLRERSLAEDALRRSEASLVEAQRVAHLGSWDWNIVENKVTQSVENCLIFGVKPDEFGYNVKEFIDIVHPDDREFVKESIDKALYEKRPYSIDFRILRPDGSVRIVHDQAEVTYNESEQAIRMLGTIQDITDQKKIEQELQRAQKLESLGILAGGIAHDFNNLLTAILGNISLAESFAYSDSKDNMYKALKEAANASIRAKSLSQQLLTFASGGLPVKKVISLEGFIKEAAGFALKGSHIGSEYSISSDLAPVEADEGQIGQVIQNLIINACQAMPDGGVINIRADNININSKDDLPLSSGKYVKISIKDQGVGIPETHINKIFDPYFTTKQIGSGLGLATTHSIIRNHGGHIVVKSQIGVGTTFCIYLPSTDKKVELEKDAEKGPSSGQGSILIMDDEEIIRVFLCDGLRHFGYEVESAINGAEAVNLYKMAVELGVPYDAVILDLTVPGGMGGKETVKELLNIDPGAKVIVSSGYSNDPIMAEYDKYGFKGVVAKPYKLKELSEVVYRVIKGISE